MKKMIHRITWYPMLEKSKATKTLGWEKLAKLMLLEWDGRGMKLNNVFDMDINFFIHIIAHKIYSSRHLNNVPCEAVDLTYKVTKKNISFDLAELHRT